ncbi:hypothetical protein IGI04_024825 [Brassica rapa subsp. trilocularis]|uniref:Uncharacterized protein n=1 Tax=Brassica rapa subsp. trilocularis TaxID=1813537 RepID=A0ABQ7M7U9_BRACM|nr:hypothetical protein IGI04_024825 [Brassica rapa subsp. trilocularis]
MKAIFHINPQRRRLLLLLFVKSVLVVGAGGTMGSSFNAQILVEKLSKLNNSQASIESILS